jgi:hypothetical protein
MEGDVSNGSHWQFYSHVLRMVLLLLLLFSLPQASCLYFILLLKKENAKQPEVLRKE